MDKDLKNKDLEQVSGGGIDGFHRSIEPHIPLTPPTPKTEPEPGPVFEIICYDKNIGTEACPYKGKSKQCSDCSKNHD